MKLIMLGSGGYGKTVADIATQLGYKINFLDDVIPDHPLSSFTDYISSDTCFIPAFGNNVFRLEWIKQIAEPQSQNCHANTPNRLYISDSFSC